MKKFIGILILTSLFACKGNEPEGPQGPTSEDFDRKTMIIHWADNIIIPALTDFSIQTATLKSDGENFFQNPSQENLNQLRVSWEEAYKGWQKVSMYNIGKAEEIRFRDNLNIYPADTAEIHENIITGTYNLELPSKNDEQGFPALDYLLFGLGDTDAEILAYYTTHNQALDYQTYVRDLTARIDALTQEVLASWSNSYRDIFVDNDGNSANASVDQLVNDYLFYYEKSLRAGKVGIPAGVFSGSPLPGHVEAFYHGGLSKTLLLEALQASQDFFNGKPHGGGTEGESLASYLDFLQTMKDGADLKGLINDQFDATRSKINLLDDNFSNQINNDNFSMLTAYDELQKNVILLKVDMLQALNINVDFVDADGD